MGDDKTAVREDIATRAQTGVEQGGTAASPALLAAQARLLQIRAEQGIGPAAPDRRGVVTPLRSDDEAPNWHLRNATLALQQKRRLQQPTPTVAGLQPYPNAAAVARAILPVSAPSRRDGQECPSYTSAPTVARAILPASAPDTRDGQECPSYTALTVHPTILTAILKQNLEAPARIYFLLRVIDRSGRGWLEVEAVREQLTRRGAPLRVMGWRRLRQLLHEGEGVFWQRDGGPSDDGLGRLWLRGAARVAAALGVERAQGYPVALPVAALLGGIGDVRAAFYAAFHSGRESKPISRATLRRLTGIAARTQLAYDRRARVSVRRNLAIGERYSAERLQERAWERGRGVFRFVDTKGHQGPPNKEYIAWGLPNSYEAGYQRRSKGSRKRLNRQLNDLVTKGIPGNGEGGVERVFFGNGALAARAYNRDPERDAYWAGREPTRRRTQLWRVMSGRMVTAVGR